MGYTKLFSEICLSTVWALPDTVRIVWITMLAIKDENHEVMASIPGLAGIAHVTRDQCEAALKILSSPDKDSRSQENEGRRIQEIRGGWKILNGEYYRKKLSKEERKEYQKQWVREKRAILSTNVDNVAKFDNVYTTEQNRTDHNRTEQIKNNKNILAQLKSDFEHFWNAYPRKEAKQRAFNSFKAIKPTPELLSTILKDIQKKASTPKWQEDNGSYIPHPATYLNGKRWEDQGTTIETWQDQFLRE